MTGAITAAGGAWNASIVAEVVSWGTDALTAKGLGLYIAQRDRGRQLPRIVPRDHRDGPLRRGINRAVLAPALRDSRKPLPPRLTYRRNADVDERTLRHSPGAATVVTDSVLLQVEEVTKSFPMAGGG